MADDANSPVIMGIDMKLPINARSVVAGMLQLERSWRAKHADTPYSPVVKEADGVLSVEYHALTDTEIALRKDHGLPLHG